MRIIIFLTVSEDIRETSLRTGQWKPETDPGGGVYGCPERPNECPDRPQI